MTSRGALRQTCTSFAAFSAILCAVAPNCVSEVLRQDADGIALQISCDLGQFDTEQSWIEETLKKTTKSGKVGLRSSQQARLPLRWDQVPHQEILLKARRSMGLRSAARAAEDAHHSLIRRRLPKNDHSDHTKYIELESVRVVEVLRQLRDQYRTYFEERGCKPIAEMYWVVVRHGIKDWAIMALRAAATDYITASQVDLAKWEALFDFSGPYNDILPPALAAQLVSKIENSQERLSKSIRALLPQTAFDRTIDGGPFGREYQMSLTQSYPGRAFLEGLETFPDAMRRRERSWEDARPWSEGLASLFEVTRQEVIAQFDALNEEAKEAEHKFVQLSDLERISYTHLVNFARGEVVTEGTAKDRWPELFSALDEAGVFPDAALGGTARETLMVARRKGLTVNTWHECYSSTARLTLDDGKPRTLRHEVTHALHNVAKKARYQLGQVWGPQKPPPTLKTASKASRSLQPKKAKQ
jgi:hypothetical protein